MGALDLGMVGGTTLPGEADVDPQGQQPQMQVDRKRRRRGVIVKDRAVIQADAPWQANRQEGTSEHEWVGREGRIGRLQTGIALNFEAAHDIDNGDQTHFPHSRYVHAALGIDFPLVMRGTLWLARWAGQVTVLLIVAREFLSFEQHCDARATGQWVICPTGINAEFRQQGIRSPAWMRPAHL